MPLTDADLIALLHKTIAALDEEAAWLVDVDFDDRGRHGPSVLARDKSYFDAVCEQAQSLRSLVELIEARRAA